MKEVMLGCVVTERTARIGGLERVVTRFSNSSRRTCEAFFPSYSIMKDSVTKIVQWCSIVYTVNIMKYVIGVDEVGRGPIAGPVVVCACALLENVDVLYLFPKNELRDSKKLSEKNRERIRNGLEVLRKENKILWGIGEVSAGRIDEIGIVPAINEAMNDTLFQLEKDGVSVATRVVLDGSLYAPERYTYQETHIKGDEKFAEIALASIIAKVYRDTFMKELANDFLGYGFENHAGYGTSAHYVAIKEHGMTIHHRRSFLKKL